MPVTVHWYGADVASRKEIFITGHGGWIPDSLWVTMPKDTTFYFYTESSRAMSQHDADRLVSGEALEPQTTIGAFKSTQNISLGPDDLSAIPTTIAALNSNPNRSECSILRVTGGNVCLSDLLTLDSVKGRKIHWCCCRSTMLNELPAKPSDLQEFNEIQPL
jgi:hypothetical protein